MDATNESALYVGAFLGADCYYLYTHLCTLHTFYLAFISVLKSMFV